LWLAAVEHVGLYADTKQQL